MASIIGEPGRPVRRVVPSPDGQCFALVYGEGRSWCSPRVDGAALFRRRGASFEKVAELPVASPHVFVQGDGACVVMLADYQGVEVIRYVPEPGTGQLKEAARWIETGGMSLSDINVGLLPPGKEVILGTTDRDDGQGWSEPTYTDIWRRVDLTGNLPGTNAEPLGGRPHLYRAPASPLVSPHDGSDLRALYQRVSSLQFRREWPVCVGPRLLLATSRVIDVRTGATLLGEERKDTRTWPVFHDLSADERCALVSGQNEVFERWDVRARTCERLPLPEHGGVRHACYLAGGEIVLGMEDGQAALVVEVSL